MTAAVAPEVSAPAKLRIPRLVPVPDCEPPFDDELAADQPGRTRWSQGAGSSVPPGTTPQLGAPARQPPIPSARGADPARPRQSETHPPRGVSHTRPAALLKTSEVPVLTRDRVRVNRPTTITSSGVPPWSSDPDIGVQKTATEHLPPAERAARVLARALVEILSGQRPVAQIRVHCAPEIYSGLLERPLTGRQALPHILTVHVCEPADGVAEVSAAFRRADRVRAMAFRIEGVDGRWRITALQVG